MKDPYALTRKEELELKMLWLDRLEKQTRTKGGQLKFYVIEIGGAKIGVPDVYFVLNGRTGWLEFKVCSNIEVPVVKYEPGQRVELRDLRARGVFSATVAITSGMDFIVAAPPRVLCNTTSDKFDLNKAPVRIKGEIDAAYDALEWMLDRFYKEN